MKRLIGRRLSKAERAVVIEQGRALLGTKWRHKGRSDYCVDCLGAIWLTLARALKITRGLVLPPPRNDYGRRPFNRELREGLIEYLGEPVAEPPQPGDVVSMRWTGNEHHVGLIVPHHFHGIGLLHADNTAAGGPRVVEHGVDEVWRRRFLEVWRP